MTALYWVVLAMMLRLSPSDDPIVRHGALAVAIATVVTDENPVFAGDDSRERTSALIVAVAFRESSLNASITGDGRSTTAARP